MTLSGTRENISMASTPSAIRSRSRRRQRDNRQRGAALEVELPDRLPVDLLRVSVAEGRSASVRTSLCSSSIPTPEFWISEKENWTQIPGYFSGTIGYSMSTVILEPLTKPLSVVPDQRLAQSADDGTLDGLDHAAGRAGERCVDALGWVLGGPVRRQVVVSVIIGSS